MRRRVPGEHEYDETGQCMWCPHKDPSKASLAAPTGSVTNEYCAAIRREIGHLRSWLGTLEKVAQPDDVIPWIQVESILRSANAIAYDAGRLNGAVMQRHESPNVALCEGAKGNDETH